LEGGESKPSLKGNVTALFKDGSFEGYVNRNLVSGNTPPTMVSSNLSIMAGKSAEYTLVFFCKGDCCGLAHC
jgi:hypothetical protein